MIAPGSSRSQSIANGSKPKPRTNNQKSRNWPASKTSYVTTKTVLIAEHSRNFKNFSDSKHFVCSTCQKYVFNANHDSCVTKFLNEVNSRAKVPSNKTTNINKPVEQTSFAKKPERHIPKGHRFSIKKTSIVHEKTMSPRSCLRWKPTGKIFKTVGLRWVPTGEIFTSTTTKVDSEPPNGSNKDITNPYECKETLNVSAGMMIPLDSQYPVGRNVYIRDLVDLGLTTINRGLIQAILASLPPQPIGEVTKASNLQRIPPGVWKRISDKRTKNQAKTNKTKHGMQRWKRQMSIEAKVKAKSTSDKTSHEGEYDIWAMKMEHYLAHTDYPIWEAIQNRNGPVSITTDTSGQLRDVGCHQSIFGGNDDQEDEKYILKQKFEGFSVSIQKVHKGYEGVDSLSFDDLYNNLRVFESDVKGSTTSSSSPQNVAFVSENTSSTNDGILLESVESREIKTTGGGMHGIQEPRMGAELDRRRILKHCLDSDTEREQLSDASIEIKHLRRNLGGFKTKHIAIRHHFIRDAYEKKLIQMLKIYTDDNVADLLTKAFDVSRRFEGFRESFKEEVIDDKQLANVSVPLDHFPVNTLTSKVFSFMVKKGKHFSGNVTPLFATMLVQPTQDEGASSERPSEAQPTPSPAPTSEVPHEPQTDSSPAHTSEVPLEQQTDPSPRPSPTTTIPDSIPETSGGNLGGHSSSDKSLSGNEGEMTLQSVYDLCLSLCAQVTDQAKEIQNLKAQIKKLKKQAKPVIHHHRAWLKSSLKQRLTRKSFPKKQRVHKESVSKQGRKFAKGEPSVQRDPLFDELPEDTVDHMETENAQDEGRTRDIVDEDKEIEENVLSTEDALSTDKDKVSTDKEKVSTDRPIVSTDGSKVSTDRHIEGTDEQVEAD
ncbi:hypothetical protein Tco_1204280 [Tanacetum coccineum]